LLFAFPQARLKGWRSCFFMKMTSPLLLSIALVLAGYSSAWAKENPAPSVPKEGALSKMPRMRTPLAPKYPKEMLAAQQPGEAMMDFLVGSDGRTSDIKVVKATNDLFAKAATEAVAHLLFEPAMRNGKAVSIRMHMPVKFRPDQP
jgi:TonB family protein